MNSRIKVHYGRTVNLGNYESMRMEIGTETDVDNEEDQEKLIREEFNFLRKLAKDLIKEVEFLRSKKEVKNG